MDVTNYFETALNAYKESVQKEKGASYKEKKDVKYRYRVLNSKEYAGVVSMNSVADNRTPGKASANKKGLLTCKKSGTIAVELQVRVKDGKKSKWVQAPGSDILFISIEKPVKVKGAKTTLDYISKGL